MQVICIIPNASDTATAPEFLQFIRMPGRRFPEVVAVNNLTSEGCRESFRIRDALVRLQQDTTRFAKVVTIDPPHNASQTFRSSAPFFTVLPFILQQNIKDVVQKDSLLNFSVATSLPAHDKSLLICGTLRDIWGPNLASEYPSSSSLLSQVNTLGYEFPRQSFFPIEGKTMYLVDVATGVVQVYHLRGKKFVLNTIQPLHS